MSDDQGVHSHRQLKVWNVGLEIAERIYRVTAGFPKHETYGLSSQMQRAAVSVPSNIAEGHARDSTKEFLHHISIAFGSLAELDTQLELSKRLGYSGAQDPNDLPARLTELGKMLSGLQRSLKAKL
jgi:four helix bundle protein